ncbi:unnamed protein product, partial [Polarella glacialis]
MADETAADAGKSSSKDRDDGKRLGLKQLRAVVHEIYAAKRLDDQRRDKAHQGRRPLHTVMQELIRRQHGVKRVVHQKSWQMVEAVVLHAQSDMCIGLFADFLDGTRDVEEFSFYLYCCSVLATAVAEESQAMPPSRLPVGTVSLTRASRLVDLLFSDLPKALAVVRAELEKFVGRPPELHNRSFDSFEDFVYSIDGRSGGSASVEVDQLCRAVLEGWRMSALLLDRSMPNFSWRQTSLAFVQADTKYRGWIDPHEVREAEGRTSLANASSMSEIRLADQTSLGAFVFRVVHRLGGNLGAVGEGQSTMSSLSLFQLKADSALSGKRAQQREACLKISHTAFSSLEKSLGVYLAWLLHSDEPRDLAVYQAVKARMYGYRCAVSTGKPVPSVHNLRCLLLVLLGHQFDLQLQREEAAPDHLGWEVTALLRVLRESWRRGADGSNGASGPDFGEELEQ